MFLPPLKSNPSPPNTDSIQTPVRKPNTAQELARLRRLEDLRGQMNDLRPSLAPPLRPLAQSPSAPTLHDFSTKTHLARLDLAYERLDAHVEQCMQQMRTAMAEQQQTMESWLQQKLAQVGRIQVPSAENQGIEIRSLALQDSEIWKKICSMEERLGKGAGVAAMDPAMLSRLSALEDRVTQIGPLLESEVRTIQERIAAKAVADTDLREKVMGFEALLSEKIAQSSSGEQDIGARLLDLEMKLAEATAGGEDVGARFLELEMKVAEAPSRDVLAEAKLAELEQQTAAKLAELEQQTSALSSKTDSKLAELEQQTSALSSKTDGKLAELDQQTSALSSKTDGKFAELEQQNSDLSRTCGEIRSAFETAIGDLAREVSDQAVAKDMKFKVLETRIDGLQAGVGDLTTRMEADRAAESSTIQEKSPDQSTLEKQISVIDGINDRISQALADESKAAMEKQMTAIEERISQADERIAKTDERILKAEETHTSMQKDVTDLKEQIESKLSERLEAVEQNLSRCVEELQTGLDELSTQLQPKGESVQAPVQASAQAVAQAPLQAPVQTFVQAPVQAPVQAAAQAPVQVLVQAPVQAPELPPQPVREEQVVVGFKVGDRVQSKEYGNIGTVIAVDADGDPKLRFDDGSVDQKYGRDFKVIERPVQAVEPVQVSASSQPSEPPPEPVQVEQVQVPASIQPELRPQPQPSEQVQESVSPQQPRSDQVQGSVSQPIDESSVAGIYALDSGNETKRQPQVIEQTPNEATPVEKPQETASSETRNVRLESAPNTEALANESKPSPPVAENMTLVRDQDTRADASKVSAQASAKPLREEMLVPPEACVRPDQKQSPNSEQGRDTSKVTFKETLVEDTKSNADSCSTEPRLLAKSIESNQGIRGLEMQEEPRESPQASRISHVEPSQMSVLANLDRTALRIEDRVSSLDSRLQLAVEAIEANKAESENKFNALESRLPEISKQDYEELARRLQNVENQPKSARKTRSRSPNRMKPESSEFDSPMYSSPVDANLQEADKRTVAAAVVMMEQKLEGYVSMEAFNDLKENMQDGLENIGERIRSAHESQMQKTESMLTQLLESRRQKSRGGKRLKTPPQDSENITSPPNASSIETSAEVLPEGSSTTGPQETSAAMLPEGSSTTGPPQASPNTLRRGMGAGPQWLPEEPLPDLRPSVIGQF